MRAGVFLGPGSLAIDNRPEPSVSHPDDVLIAVEACGICGTDLHILDTPPGHPASPGVILGHEFVGIVRDKGSGAGSVEVGQRVAVATDISCGTCLWCRRGQPNHCSNGRSMGVFEDGALAPFVIAPVAACHPIGKELPRAIAALTEPLACVVGALAGTPMTPGGSVAVFGAGAIGLIFTGLFATAGAGRIAVVEPVASRREIAASMGAGLCIDPREVDPVETIRNFTFGEGADVVVDAVGSQLGPALGCVGKAGRIILFGMNEAALTTVRQCDITRNELTIRGSFAGSDAFPQAIRILEERLVDFGPIVTHVMALEDLAEAVALLRKGQATKVVIDLADEGSTLR